MGRIKFKWNLERILSISAMSIGFLTLIIFIYQTNLMSKQNYLSILPYLQVSTSNNTPEHSYAISLLNHGVGPALIESVTMIYQDKRTDLADFDDQLLPYLRSLDPALDSLRFFSSSTLDKGIAIPANSEYPILEINNSQEDYNLLTSSLFRLQEQGLNYEIVYRSIQNEHWVLKDNSDGPVKLD